MTNSTSFAFPFLATLVLAGPLGCGVLSPTMRTVAELPDGTKKVEVVDLGLVAHVPGDAAVTSTSASAAILQWSMREKALGIEKKSRPGVANAQALHAEVESAKNVLEARAPETFANGFDIVYAYREGLTNHVGYRAQLVIGGKTYGCYLSSNGTEADVAPAKTACRSLALVASR